jgi:hypothetical protein
VTFRRRLRARASCWGVAATAVNFHDIFTCRGMPGVKIAARRSSVPISRER